MRRSNTSGRFSLRFRDATLTAVLAVSAGLLAAPTLASAAGPAPGLSGLTISRSHIGSDGGAVLVSATPRNARVCRVSVQPKIPHRPPVKGCTGSGVKWTVHLPSNDTALPIRYVVNVTARGAQHQKVTRHRSVLVAPTSEPPLISSFTASRASLEYVGGDVRLHALVDRARSCRLLVDPSVATPPRSTDCSRGHEAWTLALPENTATTPTAYTIELEVTGSRGQQISATLSVTTDAHPPPCPGQTSTATPTTTAFFNDPSTHALTDQTTVVDAEINLICDAQLPVKGVPTQISMAQYVFTLDGVSQALMWAQHYQHANVRLVIDGSNEYLFEPDGTKISNQAYDDVRLNLPSGSVVVCGPNAGQTGRPVSPGDDDDSVAFPAGTGCAGNNIMHTKLLAVSAVDANHDSAVLNSSQNFSTNAVSAAFNNGLQIVGDKSLYQLDAAYVDDLVTNQRPNFGATLDSDPMQFSDSTVTSTFGPENSPAVFPTNSKYVEANDSVTDAMAKTLASVNCLTPGAFAGSHDGLAHTIIRISMFSYGDRDSVTAALEDREAAGCDIQIIYSTMDPDTLSDLEAHGITPVPLNDNKFSYTDGSGIGPIFVHDKYVLISGGITANGVGLTNQDVVLAGSPNFTQKSLHSNDEAGIAYQQTATADPNSVSVFNAYLANWNHLAAIAATITPGATKNSVRPAS